MEKYLKKKKKNFKGNRNVINERKSGSQSQLHLAVNYIYIYIIQQVSALTQKPSFFLMHTDRPIYYLSYSGSYDISANCSCDLLSTVRCLFVHHNAMPHIKHGKVVTAQGTKALGQLEGKIPLSLTSALYRCKLSHYSPCISAAIGCLRGPQSPASYLALHRKSVGSTVIPRSSSRQSIHYVGYHIETPKHLV